MIFFIKSSPKKPELAKIKHKIILVCRALIKVIAHKELQSARQEYSYMNELDAVCKRLIEKYENETEDGVDENFVPEVDQVPTKRNSGQQRNARASDQG
jgi:hypothetical protein